MPGLDLLALVESREESIQSVHMSMSFQRMAQECLCFCLLFAKLAEGMLKVLDDVLG